MIPRIAIAAAALCLLGACHEGSEIEDPDAPTTTSETGDEAAPLAQDLLGILETHPEHATLVSAIEASGLGEALNGDGPTTLFAPDDDAFEALPESRLEQLIQLSDKAELRRILEAHVVPKALDKAAIDAAIEAGDGKAEFTTVGGGTLSIAKQGDGYRITAPGGNRAQVTEAAMTASNGVVYSIDTVLQPQEDEAGDVSE